MKTLAALSVLGIAMLIAGADWPGFRGPNGSGVSEEKGLPVRWSEMQNLVWKVKLPGPGSSCPIVCKDRVLVTCYSGYGLTKAEKGDVKDLRLHLVCVDRLTGKIMWDAVTPTKLPETKYVGNIREHGYASSTPVTDGEAVYVFFGRTGVLAFDFAGKQLWHTEVGQWLNSWGSGASPILAGNNVIVSAGVEANALIALDKRTGKQTWRAKGIGDAWSTPLLVDVKGGKSEVVLNNQGTLWGFDAATGEKLWNCEGISTSSATSSPVTRNGIIYAMGSGFGESRILAIKAGGRGDVTKTHVVWTQKGGAGNTSPLVVGDYLYWIGANAGCVKADTGEPVFRQRLFGGGRDYGSPVAADGKIYFFSRYDGAYVLAVGPKLEQLAHNQLGDKSQFNASPAISSGQIFIRSDEALYCIGEKKT